MDVQNEDMRLQQLARMASCRRSVSKPDVDAEWKKFRSKHIAAEVSHKNNIRTIWLSALSGAAAMFIGFIIYINFFASGNEFIALQYDETPRMITLSSDGDLENLTQHDSMTYYAGDVSAVGGHHASSTALATTATTEHKMQCLSTPRGMDFKLTLHDGTEVWLNAESTIEFPSTFTDTERRVKMKGEAYFKVAHNEARPFVVDLGDKTIHVLGTEFDVRNYASETAKVVLVKGSVELCNAEGETEARLTPGKGALWVEDDVMWVEDVDVYSATQWIDDLFYFEEHALGVILRDIGRWYNYGVVFKNEKHYSYKVHFSAERSDDIERIISNLNLLCGFKITIENKNIVVY